MGMLTFLDPARPDSAATIAQAKEFGIRTKMITGTCDARANAWSPCFQKKSNSSKKLS
jgi:cation transport ATPase